MLSIITKLILKFQSIIRVKKETREPCNDHCCQIPNSAEEVDRTIALSKHEAVSLV